MILELTASRAMAPILGSSLYTWTAVIGVVLAGLSLGAYIGGKYIDKKPLILTLQKTLYISGGSVCVMMFLFPAMYTVALLPLSIPFLATGIASLLFFVPATLLGAIQPMVVKLSTDGVVHLGRSYGTLSALWSLGSIIGVFVSGFFLIPYLGTAKTFLLVALILFVSAIMLMKKRIVPIAIFFLLLIPVSLISIPNGKHVLFSKDTGYFRALVAEAYVQPFGNTRIFFLDIDTHSILRGTTTVPIYTDITRLFSKGVTASSSTLVIGGGAYTMPNDLARNTPASVDVYEIDPEVPLIVEKYFTLDPKITTTIGDARTLLRKDKGTYDIIVGDSFNSYLSVPWHLLTKEFNRDITQRLAPEGIYAVNVISPIVGEGSALYRSVDRTLRQTFSFVEAYRFGEDSKDIQNIVFLASQTPLDRWLALGKETAVLSGKAEVFENRRIHVAPTSGIVLTDDHAPTDTMLLPIAKRALPSSIGLYHAMTH